MARRWHKPVLFEKGLVETSNTAVAPRACSKPLTRAAVLSTSGGYYYYYCYCYCSASAATTVSIYDIWSSFATHAGMTQKSLWIPR